MYADNTVMYFAASNTQEISSTLTSELAKVNDWLVHSSLFIHPGKTECILFGTGSRLANVNLSVNIDGKELTKVAEYKILRSNFGRVSSMERIRELLYQQSQ